MREGEGGNKMTKQQNFEYFSRELGPGTITIGTVFFWSLGFWDYRPDSLMLRPKSDICKITVGGWGEGENKKTRRRNFPVTDPLSLVHPGKIRRSGEPLTPIRSCGGYGKHVIAPGVGSKN